MSQFDDNSNEYVCQYASRLLKGAEIHYGITEKECLEVIWAIRQFRTYVHGVHFHVITNHNALVWFKSIRDPSGKLARWQIINSHMIMKSNNVKVACIQMWIHSVAQC